MVYKVRTFGIASDIMGGKVVPIDMAGKTVSELRAQLSALYPDLDGLRSLLIAVNLKYAADEIVLKETDEIALIPPVSGG